MMCNANGQVFPFIWGYNMWIDLRRQKLAGKDWLYGFLSRNPEISLREL